MRAEAFWDASALVSLCVYQSTTPRALVLWKAHELVIWWASPVEIASALARLARMKQLAAGDFVKAQRLANTLAESWAMIQPSDALRVNATQLVNRYDLRAADSLQLAAALQWCQGAPQGRVFLTADERLREAALLSGFDAGPI